MKCLVSCQVFIGRQDETSSNDFATSGAKSGAVDAVNHLVSLGHTRIGFVGGAYRRGIGVGRWRGYRQALAAHGLPLMPEPELATDTTTVRNLLPTDF